MANQNSFQLTNRVALVTGAGGILGEYFCRGLAEAGAHIALVDVTDDSTKKRADNLQKEFGTQCRSYVCDITDPQQVSQLVDSVKNDLGDITILHNNAAAKTSDLKEFFKPYEEYSLSTWREVMDVNIDGMFLVSQAVGKHMLSHQKPSSIIQTASIYGIVAPDQRIYKGSDYMGGPINTPAVYSASKAAVIGLTKYLASYWGDKNIRVNALTPGGVESGQNDTFKKNYSQKSPMGRMANAEEMVGALIYLASPASSYVNGHNLIVDGGWSAW